MPKSLNVKDVIHFAFFQVFTYKPVGLSTRSGFKDCRCWFTGGAGNGVSFKITYNLHFADLVEL